MKYLCIGDYLYRQAAKTVMYHGTATGEGDEILRKILKEGLNPDASKVFEGDDQGDFHKREIETLGGIYLSVSPRGVTGYADGARRKFGGDNLVAIVQIEPRTPTVSLDEDMLFGSVTSPFLADYIRREEGLNLNEYLALQIVDDVSWEEVAEYFLEFKARKRKELSVPKKREKAVLSLLSEVLKLETEYWLAKSYERGNMGSSTKWNYEQRGVEDPKQLLREYRLAMDRFLKKLREAVTPAEDREWQGHTIRIQEPINYRGANKIIALLRWREDLDRKSVFVKPPGAEYGHSVYDRPYSAIGKVVYQTSGSLSHIKTFIESLSKSWGPSMLWKDKNGKVLYDEPSPTMEEEELPKAASVRRESDGMGCGWKKTSLKNQKACLLS